MSARAPQPAPPAAPPRLTVVFAGGGTGGHIFPGLAIAEEVRARDPAAAFLFLCSGKPIDAEVLQREGHAFVPLAARPFSARPRAMAAFLTSWGPSVRRARAALRAAAAAGPARLVALGGYVAPPAVRAARAERCPVLMVNLDAVPGKANRWIARRAGRTLTAAPGGPAEWERIGPVVRRDARAGAPPQECRRRLGLDPQRPTLLVTGGSLGAGSINQLVLRLLRDRPGAFAGWQAIHQCGRDRGQGQSPGDIESAYAAAACPAAVTPLIRAMGQAWGAADLALCRAGAGTVAEAWANRVPALFLPYPYHRDQHQRANATPLVRAGGAEVCDDLIEPDRNAPHAGARLLALMADADARSRMRRALGGLGPADGAARVADILLAPP